jgi:hypothetical protein
MAKTKRTTKRTARSTSAKRGRRPPMRRILNCLPSADQGDDWAVADARDAGIVAASPPPASLDLRKDCWKIGNQGSMGLERRLGDGRLTAAPALRQGRPPG